MLCLLQRILRKASSFLLLRASQRFAEQQASIVTPPKKGLGNFLSQVKDAASRVVDDTSKNLNQVSCMLPLHLLWQIQHLPAVIHLTVE